MVYLLQGSCAILKLDFFYLKIRITTFKKPSGYLDKYNEGVSLELIVDKTLWQVTNGITTHIPMHQINMT